MISPALLLQPFLVETPCNFESFGVNGDGDISIASLYRGLSHRQDRAAAVTPYRMHLEIAL
jgi:hypothetical protein